MRFHILALPNAQTTKDYSLCGFAMVTRRFCQMMKSMGHTVFLYASEENDAHCDELITVITKEEQETLLSSFSGRPNTACEYQYAWIDERSPIWQLSNPRTIKEISKRKEPRDFICGVGGSSQESIAIAHKDLMFVEYSIGYQGSFSPYRVFESHIWRTWTYAYHQIIEGRFFDEVIPCFFDPEEFPFKSDKEQFALYVGRLIPRKGVTIACQAAEAARVPLKVIGHGDESLVTNGAEYLGALPLEQRNEWMSRASAVFCPTQYIEPFCCVAAEAQLCGTPVISTAFGGFVENIEHGKTGYLCNYLGEFVEALLECDKLNTHYIRDHAVKRFGMDNVKHQYQRYFDRLMLLWNGGWNSMEASNSACQSVT